MSSVPPEQEPIEGRVLGEVSGPDEEIAHLKDEVTRLGGAGNISKHLEALLKLGVAYLDDCQFGNAEHMLRQVKTQMVEVWGWHHTATMGCLKGLVKISVAHQDFGGAVELYKEGIVGVRRAVGSEHPWISELQNNAACLCNEWDDLPLAETLLRKSLKAKLSVFGKDHRSTFKTKCNLALVHYLRGNTSDFEPILQSVLWRSREIYGDGDEITVAIARQLIGLYFTTENAEAGHFLCRDLHIQPHIENRLTTVHYDNHIPSIHTTKSINEEPPPDFQELLTMIGPHYSRKIISTLRWTREKITTWAGISVNEFADLVGVPIDMDWNNLTDANVLLNEAAILGHETTVQMLLDNRRCQEDNFHYNRERTIIQNAMHNACSHGNDEVVRLFLNREVNVNGTDFTGTTALHKAARHGHRDVVVALLEFNADTYVRDQNGHTAIDAAIAGDFEDVIRVLMEHQGALVVSSASKSESTPEAAEYADAWDDTIWTGMEATVVDFFIDNSVEAEVIEEHRIKRLPVETVIWGLSSSDTWRSRSGSGFESQAGVSSRNSGDTRSGERNSSGLSQLSVNQNSSTEHCPVDESHFSNTALSYVEPPLDDPLVGQVSMSDRIASEDIALEAAALNDEAAADFNWIHLPANNANVMG